MGCQMAVRHKNSLFIAASWFFKLIRMQHRDHRDENEPMNYMCLFILVFFHLQFFPISSPIFFSFEFIVGSRTNNNFCSSIYFTTFQ